MLEQNWKSFFNACREYRVHPEKFNGCPKPPKYKGELFGIIVDTTPEDHTSKCSFLDDEPIMHHERYQGTRMTRGLFKSKNEQVINADCNGAYNIAKKVVPNAFMADGIEGVGLHPVLLKLP